MTIQTNRFNAFDNHALKKSLVAAALTLALTTPVWAADKVNINTAKAGEIAQMLKGVGNAKAAAIVEYRKQHGPFKSVDELENVKGIGEKMLVKNASVITLK